MVREGLNALLSTYPEMEVADLVATGEDAIERALEVRPNVVLMALLMPGCGGVEATQRIHESTPEVAVVLTMVDEDEDEDEDEAVRRMRTLSAHRCPTMRAVSREPCPLWQRLTRHSRQCRE
ncbi:response regulator transcription factor [Actinoplanes sp. NPDC089786]|uniref:response regulator n=1 Tax=Actinoplanes sp. NPDC089786 TaxID=3155185 RepID=UPI00342171FB